MTTIDISIAETEDDVIYSSNLTLGTSNLIVGKTSATKTQSAGLRFLNVTIPQGSIIDVAYILFKANGVRGNNDVLTDFRGWDTDNATQITSVAEWDIAVGELTVASTTWNNLPQWITDTVYQSPSLVSIIQEITDRVGWVSGNAANIFWLDDGSSDFATRRPYDYFDDPAKVCVLHIEFSEPSIASSFGSSVVSGIGVSAIRSVSASFGSSVVSGIGESRQSATNIRIESLLAESLSINSKVL